MVADRQGTCGAASYHICAHLSGDNVAARDMGAIASNAALSLRLRAARSKEVSRARRRRGGIRLSCWKKEGGAMPQHRWRCGFISISGVGSWRKTTRGRRTCGATSRLSDPEGRTQQAPAAAPSIRGGGGAWTAAAAAKRGEERRRGGGQGVRQEAPWAADGSVAACASHGASASGAASLA